jgi:small nuclear ribonucleoprotein (snRNP)-like protein
MGLGATGMWRLWSVIRTYSLKHEKREEIEGLLRAYNETLNAVIEDIWESTRWRKVKIKGF